VTVRLVYETHQWSTDNEAGIATGWLPGTLSERGRESSVELGRRRRGVDAVVVSDLRRAVETVEIAFAGTDVPIVRDARLRECDYGDLNGAPVAEVAALRSSRVDEPFPGGESYRDVVARTASLLSWVAGSYGGCEVLLVGHSANQLALDHLLLGAPLAELVAAPFAWQEGWTYVLGPP
jgi:broad specificity phosphatase PhoE